MKITLLLAIVATISLSSFKGEKTNEAKVAKATTEIAGSIIDENTGETLVGVEVTLEGTNQKTYTDFDGNFTFSNVNEGKYNIKAKMISYQEVSKKDIKVDASKNNTLNLKMSLVN